MNSPSGVEQALVDLAVVAADLATAARAIGDHSGIAVATYLHDQIVSKRREIQNMGPVDDHAAWPFPDANSPQPRPNFTAGPWRPGKAYRSVVSDTRIPDVSSQDELHYYGGYLVAESIAERNLPLVATAPELYDFIDTLENDDGHLPSWIWTWRARLLRHARGEA